MIKRKQFLPPPSPPGSIPFLASWRLPGFTPPVQTHIPKRAGTKPANPGHEGQGDESDVDERQAAINNGESSGSSSASDDDNAAAAPSQNESESSDSHESSLLRAPTLVLGQSPKAKSDHESGSASSRSTLEQSSDEEEEEEEAWPDSQVSSGWLGKAYSHFRQREEKEQAKSKVKMTMRDLEGDLRTEVGQHPCMPGYLAYCKDQLCRYGESCYSSLTSRDAFLTWLRGQKGDKDSGVLFGRWVLFSVVVQCLFICANCRAASE